MKLLLLITAQMEAGLDVAQSWQDNGAPGVTIIQSHGLHRLRQEAKRVLIDLPLATVSIAGALAHLLDSSSFNTQIVLSAVEDDVVDTLVERAESILGDLNIPNNGVLVVLDIERALGVGTHGRPR